MTLKQYRIEGEHSFRSSHSMALHLCYTEKYPSCFRWPKILAGITRIRGRTFTWTPSVEARPTQAILDWLKKTPVLKDWVTSDQCLVSPLDWPSAVYPAFKHSLIPSPHEIANVNTVWGIRLPPQQLRSYLTVYLYCMGFTVEQIAEATQDTERNVLVKMSNGIEVMNDNPRYLLWASGTDFSRSVFPVNIMRMPLSERAEIVDALIKNPWRLKSDVAKQVLVNPSYFSYLIYGSPKRMRLTKDCRLYRTGER